MKPDQYNTMDILYIRHWITLLILQLFLVTHAVYHQEFRVGVIMVEKSVLPFKMEMVGPAIDIAMKDSEREYGIHFRKFESLYPGWCNAVASTGAVADLYYKHNISMLIGPGCSGDVTVCGYLATHWNLPLVSGVGDLVLGKEKYPTFTRLSYSLEKQSLFFTTILNQFKWGHVAIIYDVHDILMQVQGKALTKALRADVTLPRPYDITFDTTKNPNMEALLYEASQHARVILFLSSGGDLRKFMLQAHSRGMTKGEYAFITIELFRSKAWGDFSWKRGDDQDEDAKESFKSLLFISLTSASGARWTDFKKEVVMRAKRDYNYTYGEEVNYFVGAFYDSVIYLAISLNRTIEEGQSLSDGRKIAQKLWNSTFPGIMGNVFVDEIGDRIADYSLLDMTDTANGVFEIVAKYYGSRKKYEPVPGKEIHWPGGRPPLDKPPCGFKNDAPHCQSDQTVMVVAVGCSLAGFFLVSAIVIAVVYRRFRFEAELSNMSWRVKWDDVVLSKGLGVPTSTSRLSLISVDVASKGLGSIASGDIVDQIFTTIGHYKGNVVAVRNFKQAKIEQNRPLLLELKQIRALQHDNLTRFVGACIDPDCVAILTEYCPKGSLQDILANDAIKLDWMFRYSLINDIVRGMCYLHSSEVRFHRRLKSSNCVVDGRFVLKVTDFGLPTFYNQDVARDKKNLHSFYRQKFWRAPELLDNAYLGSQPGDVYSFGIILQEVITRTEPYEDYDLSPKEVIARVKGGEKPPFRPKVVPSLCSSGLFKVMENCWAEEPETRPLFSEVKSSLKHITQNKDGQNILDNLLRRMELYANNLESLVEERTQAFLDEKKKSEELLYRVLPKTVADQLKQGKSVQPEAFECVTIFFSDIVGFTALCSVSTPFQVVDLLNDLYTRFDAIIDEFDVYKVETIGDAYMVVSGLPIKNGYNHAAEICRMSLSLLDATKVFKIRHKPTERIQLRIGVHSGSCVAGVVGLTMPRYCLFGDTVNTASRMESNGEALRIHVSPTTKEILDKFGTFDVCLRGEVAMKGKGTVTTYWLNGEYAQICKGLDRGTRTTLTDVGD